MFVLFAVVNGCDPQILHDLKLFVHYVFMYVRAVHIHL